ncbi:S-adenosyl-L-methionine-dependent methyltransferase [Leucosporidium creatinivorum]|uniref:S-adenosyl-L-methionine-dependent methyltransferase n=1 Tax=Leucosporidium creatinivorum TaxID=106004 RepID=A0A1Y2FCZ5_9BASI|nr:S-adenosyl-L-methionine-dependent methyltransferase [Leucosporidium creatinivorum]
MAFRLFSSTSSRLSTRCMSTQRGNNFTGWAEQQFGASGSSGLYDRARPSYPLEAREAIYAHLPPHSTAVELGSGTGIFSRLLLADGGGKLEKLISTEPSAGMREGWSKALTQMKDRDESVKFEIVDGLFDKIDRPDASADLVIVAQAFHWVGHDGTSAIAEIARVLKPGAVAIFIWNLEDREQDWVAKLRDLYEVHEAGTPQYRHFYWKSVYDTPVYKANFEPYEKTEYRRSLPTCEDLVVDRVLSKSYITALDEKTKGDLSEKVRELVKKAEDKVWIDEGSGTFEYPYVTDMFVMKKKAQA